MKVKIYGAGSIGNHLAQAARRKKWDVTVVDVSSEALERMKNDIYPKRYGAWDPEIKLCLSKDDPKGGFDVICVGTPPNVRLAVSLEALKEKPKILQLEKPLCTPNLAGLVGFTGQLDDFESTHVLVGYDHSISPSFQKFCHSPDIKAIMPRTIEVQWRENWEGIFKAHPWMRYVWDSYLAYTHKGGGSGCEHSHGLHLWVYLWKLLDPDFAQSLFWNHVTFSSTTDVVRINADHGQVVYDECHTIFASNRNGRYIGSITTDVYTRPTRKLVIVQGERGRIEWEAFANFDEVRTYMGENNHIEIQRYPKTRQDDFFNEMEHIESIINNPPMAENSPLSLEHAVDVMKILHNTLPADLHDLH